MAYKCLDCGHIFEEGEQAVWYETHGLDTPPYEKWSGCPLCKGSYEKTIQCDICGSEHLKEELSGGVCEECIESYRYDINICYEIGKKDDSAIKLNSFLATMFDKDEIEEILFEALLKDQEINKKVDCQKYIDSDKNWFGEILAEEVTK